MLSLNVLPSVNIGKCELFKSTTQLTENTDSRLGSISLCLDGEFNFEPQIRLANTLIMYQREWQCLCNNSELIDDYLRCLTDDALYYNSIENSGISIEGKQMENGKRFIYIYAHRTTSEILFSYWDWLNLENVMDLINNKIGCLQQRRTALLYRIRTLKAYLRKFSPTNEMQVKSLLKQVCGTRSKIDLELLCFGSNYLLQTYVLQDVMFFG